MIKRSRPSELRCAVTVERAWKAVFPGRVSFPRDPICLELGRASGGTSQLRCASLNVMECSSLPVGAKTQIISSDYEMQPAAPEISTCPTCGGPLEKTPDFTVSTTAFTRRFTCDFLLRSSRRAAKKSNCNRECCANHCGRFRFF